MKQRVALILFGCLLFRGASHGAVTGQWDFDSGDLRATIGTALQYVDEAEGATARGTAFDTTAKFGLPAIGGEVAKVIRFPQMTSRTMGYVATHGADPNGEGEKVNQYTVLMDIFFPVSSSSAFRSLLQTDNTGDGDFYVNPANGIGTVGDYAGNLTPGAWHRLVLAVDVSQRVPIVSKYVDGVKAARQTLSQGRDGRWSLGPSIGLFNDPNGESRVGYLNSLQIRDRTLSDGEVRLLGGPTARGFPTNDHPDHPFVESTLPPANAFGVPADSIIQAVISDGKSVLKRDAIVLLLNGRRVNPEISRSGTLTTVGYQPGSSFTNITNSVVLTYPDGQAIVTNTWRFVTKALSQKRSITGQWDFDQSNLVATIGLPLQYLDGPGGASQRACQFNTTTAFGIGGINGTPARVLSFAGAFTPTIGLILPHGAIPNGGESPTRVNQWTLIMDILIPNARKEPWLALLQTDPENTSNADLFISLVGERGGIGSLGNYSGEGELMPGQWHRIAVAVDVGAFTMSKYIDGVLFATQPLSATELDGRYSLAPTVVLFGDEDGDSQPACLNSVQVRNYTMDENEIAALGGPDARGISTAPIR